MSTARRGALARRRAAVDRSKNGAARKHGKNPMTTKFLTMSNYPGGYSLNASYSRLVIDLGVSVGSSSAPYGVYSAHAASIVSYGTVTVSSKSIGVYLKAGGTVIN